MGPNENPAMSEGSMTNSEGTGKFPAKKNDSLDKCAIVRGESSELSTFFFVIKAFMGLGIFAMPAAWKEAGIVSANCFCLLIGGLTYYSMRIQL